MDEMVDVELDVSYSSYPCGCSFCAAQSGNTRMIRKTLASSHVAAVTIAVLLFWSAGSFFQALEGPVASAIEYAITGIAILGIPYRTIADRGMLVGSSAYLYSAAFSFGAAWLVSRWVYRTGPLRALRECGRRLLREG